MAVPVETAASMTARAVQAAQAVRVARLVRVVLAEPPSVELAVLAERGQMAATAVVPMPLPKRSESIT